MSNNAGGVARELKKHRKQVGGSIRVIEVGKDPEGIQPRGHYSKSHFPRGRIESWADEVRCRPELQGLSDLSPLDDPGLYATHRPGTTREQQINYTSNGIIPAFYSPNFSVTRLKLGPKLKNSDGGLIYS